MKASLLCVLLALVPAAGLAQDTTSTAADTSYETYSESPVSLPLGIGLRVPTYDRVNGLSLPWGPQLSLGEDRVQVDALVRYRSNLGKWDPSIEGTLRPGTDNEIKIFAGRGTFSNDTWIRSDLLNSLAAIAVGSDARNYFRGDRATARFTRTIVTQAFTLTPFLAGNFERDWSTGSIDPEKWPWSFFGGKSLLRMRRQNPRVETGHITSIVGGSGINIMRGGVEGHLDAQVERSLNTTLAPDCSGLDFLNLPVLPGGPACPLPVADGFTQFTLDSKIQFPTFGAQTFAFSGHAVLTTGSNAPPQRFAYLGGSSTLATVNLLALGGDRLLYVQGDYTIPFNKVQITYAGTPFVALHYGAGSAGVDTLPPLIQNLGVGVGIGLVRVDFAIDPARNRSPFSRRSATTVSLSLPF
jgi:hypothetical protein